ncbi:MAG: N-acetylglucosamine-6-phosphate deacetylase [Propionicimonas sp.]
MLINASRALLGDATELAAGWIEIEGQQIVAVGTGEPPRPADQQVDDVLVPGYVDVHSHGGGGASFVTEDPDVARVATAAHRRLGTTSMVASLVTGGYPDLHRQVACLAGLVEAGELLGIHLEGPWLSERYKGAHPPQLLVDPAPAEVAALLRTGGGTVKMATIAPERAGALESIRLMVEAGCLAAVGHTDADFDTTVAAIEAGARGATHLFNAMPGLKHRAPGPVLALWRDPRVTVELVMDGVHVRPELVAWVMATAPGRVALVTDAMAAAAHADGDYVLGELAVEVRDGVARLAGQDTIAGSTLTLDRAVRNCVAAGVDLVAAVRAASTVPADYLGLGSVGRIAAGKRADLVVLDDELHPARVMWRGVWQ